MPGAFFKGSELAASRPRASSVPKCGACGLFKTCQSPKMEVSGEGERRVLIIGESPGRNEDEQGKTFVGKDGRILREALADFGVKLRRDCWTYNAVICKPTKGARPTPKQVEYCRPNVINTINKLKPDTIILLGDVAVSSVVGWLWKENPGPINRWIGWQIPSQKLNAWICPTYHPAHFTRKEKSKEGRVPELLFHQQLRSAFRLKSRPWKEVPNWRETIRPIYKPAEAAAAIRAMIAFGYPVAIDYETNMLKPDPQDREVVSCSMFDGTSAIAYPWIGDAITATGEMLNSRVPKIASNIKFEDRWTRAVFGFPVRNWLYDTMNGAHVLDNRSAITSIKFQSFVLLGYEKYDDHIEKFLRSKKGENINQIQKEIELSQLLEYNALDSILEYFVAGIQMKKLGLEIPKGMKHVDLN